MVLLIDHDYKGNDKCFMTKDKDKCEGSCAWLLFITLWLLFFVSVSDWNALLNGCEH